MIVIIVSHVATSPTVSKQFQKVVGTTDSNHAGGGSVSARTQSGRGTPNTEVAIKASEFCGGIMDGKIFVATARASARPRTFVGPDSGSTSTSTQRDFNQSQASQASQGGRAFIGHVWKESTRIQKDFNGLRNVG